jgi:hypothetical protein
MFRNSIFTQCLCAFLALAGLLSTAHAVDSCQPVFDALTKLATTPKHSYSTHIANGKPVISESIYAQGKSFIRVDGKWMNSRMGPKEILEQEAENRKNATTTCQVVRQESVNGQAATVYSLHSKSEDAIEDAQMWISKSTGLLLRQEIDLDAGEGGAAKNHLSTRYEYGNIQPPM